MVRGYWLSDRYAANRFDNLPFLRFLVLPRRHSLIGIVQIMSVVKKEMMMYCFDVIISRLAGMPAPAPEFNTGLK